MCLAATAALSLVVAHGTRPYGFEDSAIDLLARPSAVRAWVDLIGLLAAPAILAALMVSFAVRPGKASRLSCRCLRGFCPCGARHQRACGQAAGPANLLRRTHVPLRERHRSQRDGGCHVVGALPSARGASAQSRTGGRRRLGPADVIGRGRRALAHAARRTGIHLAIRRDRHGRGGRSSNRFEDPPRARSTSRTGNSEAGSSASGIPAGPSRSRRSGCDGVNSGADGGVHRKGPSVRLSH